MDVKRVDLINQLVDKYHYTKSSAESVVDDFCDIVIDNLKMGNTISIYGFGCFDILERKERRCPHPISGDPVSIPAHWIPRFYPGALMRRAVKIWEDNEKRGIPNG